MLIDLLFFFFFFKQKTAYEMRISDWSSDVCSSDLVPKSEPRRSGTSHRVWSAWNVLSRDEGSLAPTRDRKEGSWWALTGSNRRPSRCKRDALPTELSAPPDVAISGRCALPQAAAAGKRSGTRGQSQPRSEEHTSELQSPMRISYA